MGRFIYFVLIVFSFWGSGCSKIKEDCIEAGVEITQTRVVEAFEKIKADNRMDIWLVQDSSKAGTIELFGPANLLDGITTVLVNGQLQISNDNRCKWLRELDKRIQCTLYVADLVYIEAIHNATFQNADSLKLHNLTIEQRSTGDIKLLLNVGTLTINHRESGVLELKGHAAIFIPTLYETGRLDSKLLKSEIIFAYHYGLGRLDVYPLYEMHLTVENKGNSYYHHEPSNQLTVKGSGPGKLIKAF